MKGRTYLKHDFLGYIEITEESDGISGIYFLDEKRGHEIESPLVLECKIQLEEYFRGERREFDIKLDLTTMGTDFQRSCWKAMYKIPYGKTISYSEEAQMIKKPKAVRAVGGANSKNPVSIVVP